MAQLSRVASEKDVTIAAKTAELQAAQAAHATELARLDATHRKAQQDLNDRAIARIASEKAVAVTATKAELAVQIAEITGERDAARAAAQRTADREAADATAARAERDSARTAARDVGLITAENARLNQLVRNLSETIGAIAASNTWYERRVAQLERALTAAGQVVPNPAMKKPDLETSGRLPEPDGVGTR